MKGSAVWLKQCGSYDDGSVDTAVTELGDGCGLGEDVRGKSIMFKVNAATGGSPDLARCTHPEVTAALIRYAHSRGAKAVYIADSSAVYGYTSLALSHSEISTAAERQGAEVINIDALPPRLIPVDTPFPLFSGDLVFKVDILVSVAKLKTHSFTGFTGTVKNMMGVIQGAQKARMHSSLSKRQFLQTLARICAGVNTAYGIIDGIMGMEGNGPSDGKPRYIGLLAASQDLVAVDTIVSAVAGLGPECLELLSVAAAEGLGTVNRKEIQLMGDNIPPLSPPLRPPDRLFTLKERIPWTHALLYKLRERATVPAVSSNLCSLCGLCELNCPVRAITRTNSRPVINYRLCCRCFYCAEICPTRTITVRTSRVLKKFVKARMKHLNLIQERSK